MRVFTIDGSGTFTEYLSKPFQSSYQEKVLEEWLESNPDGIVEDGKLLIIGRQVSTNFGTMIDLLAIDRAGDVVVIELKRDRTPRETLAQALEYASYVEALSAEQLETILAQYLSQEPANLAEYHRAHFALAPDEAVSFNKDQRIVIVGHRVTEEIKQTSSFLRNKGIRVTCLEFSYFESGGGLRLLSHDIVVGGDSKKAAKVSSASLPTTSKQKFMEALDTFGRPVFERLLSFAEERHLPIHWGTKGFSLNVDLDGTHVALCFGYPPAAVYRQSVYTALYGRGGLLSKVNVQEDTAARFFSDARSTGLFKPAGRELRWPIDRTFAPQEIDSALQWLDRLAAAVAEHGLPDMTG